MHFYKFIYLEKKFIHFSLFINVCKTIENKRDVIYNEQNLDRIFPPSKSIISNIASAIQPINRLYTTTIFYSR